MAKGQSAQRRGVRWGWWAWAWAGPAKLMRVLLQCLAGLPHHHSPWCHLIPGLCNQITLRNSEKHDLNRVLSPGSGSSLKTLTCCECVSKRHSFQSPHRFGANEHFVTQRCLGLYCLSEPCGKHSPGNGDLLSELSRDMRWQTCTSVDPLEPVMIRLEKVKAECLETRVVSMLRTFVPPFSRALPSTPPKASPTPSQIQDNLFCVFEYFA